MWRCGDVELAELLFSGAKLFQLLHLPEFGCGTRAHRAHIETKYEIPAVRDTGKRGAQRWHGGEDSAWLQSAVTTSEEQQSSSGSLHHAIDYTRERHPLFLRALAAPANAWLKKNWLTNLFIIVIITQIICQVPLWNSLFQVVCDYV